MIPQFQHDFVMTTVLVILGVLIIIVGVAVIIEEHDDRG